MADGRKIRNKRNEGAGSQQVSSSKHQLIPFRNGTEVYIMFSLETILSLLATGEKFDNPRIEELLRDIQQHKKADPVAKKSHSGKKADPVAKKSHSGKKSDPVGKKSHSERDFSLRELNKQHAEAAAELKAIEGRKKALKKLLGNETARLFSRPVNELNLEEALHLMSKMEDAQVKLRNHFAKNSVKPSGPAESCSSNVAESGECSTSIASGGSRSVDLGKN